ncbi:MAG: hypothetical protein ABWW65_01690 [Thermoprotei archaeon]
MAVVVVPSGTTAMFVHGFLILDPNEFLKFLSKSSEERIVVLATKDIGIVHKKRKYVYAAVYGGFTLLTITGKPLSLPSNTSIVRADDVLLPPAVWTRLLKKSKSKKY